MVRSSGSSALLSLAWDVFEGLCGPYTRPVPVEDDVLFVSPSFVKENWSVLVLPSLPIAVILTFLVGSLAAVSFGYSGSLALTATG